MAVLSLGGRLFKRATKMEQRIMDILQKISEISVDVTTILQALVAFVGGIFVARKKRKEGETPKSE